MVKHRSYPMLSIPKYSDDITLPFGLTVNVTLKPHARKQLSENLKALPIHKDPSRSSFWEGQEKQRSTVFVTSVNLLHI